MLHQQEHHTDSLSWRENPRQKSKLFGKAQQEGEEGRKWERGRSGGEEDKRRRESGKEEEEEVQGGGGCDREEEDSARGGTLVSKCVF